MIPGAAGQIRVFHDLEALSRAAADLFFTLSHMAIAARKKFTVALSGGSTPARLYSLLGSDEYCEKITWQGVHVFWTDERAVPKEHPESNYRLADTSLLSKVPLPAGNIHRIRGEEEPRSAAQRYEEEIRQFFGGTQVPVFDLVILGAGEDGHTASLFPGSAPLNERVRLAAPVLMDRPKIDRVTLTLPVLNHAAHILFLVSGRKKGDILRELLEGEHRDTYPAGLVQPVNGSLEWLVDKDAAALLRNAG